MRGTPIMQFDGGNGTSRHLLGCNLNGAKGYAAHVQDEKLFQRYFRNGQWPRILFKHPGGTWFNRPDWPGWGSYFMWPDQFLYAKSVNAPFAENHDMEYIHSWWFDNGVEEVINYIGRPDILDDPYEQGLKCVETIRQSGPADKVSIAWDAASEISNTASEKLDRVLMLFRELREAGHKIYIEAIPAVGQDIWTGEIDGVYCLKSFADKHPDRVKWIMDGGLGEGVEMIVGTNDNQIHNDNPEIFKTFPKGATRAGRRHWAYNLDSISEQAA